MRDRRRGGTANLADALRTRVGSGIVGRCVATGRSLLVLDALRCDFARPVPGTSEIDETIAVVPLRHGARITGAIVLSKLGVGALDADDVRLLEVIAGHTSIALENARLYEAQRREAENAKALLAFAEAVSRAPAFPSICHDTAAAAAEMAGSDRASLWIQAADGTFACRAMHGFDDDSAAEAAAIARTVVPAASVERWLRGRNEPFLSPAEEARAALPPAPWGRLFVAPLVSGSGVTGWIATRTEAAAMGEETRRLLTGLVYHASTALQKAWMYERQRESAEVANALLEASREVAAGGGADEVAARVVEVTARVCGALRVTLWVANDQHDVVARASAGAAAPERRRLPAAVVRSWLERVGPFALGADEGVPELGAADATRVAVAPFRIGGIRLAALTVDLGDREPREPELRILAGLASQAKLALKAAEHNEGLERTFVSTIEALANALEANDAYTSTHARWISDAALEVGRALDLDRAALKRLELAALFHDIGKIGIPSEILRKAGPLDDRELAIVRRHPELGSRILEPIDRLADVRPIVRACHERWDGDGYPDGKTAEEIPLEARVVLVCDSFHAMTTDRPYRRRLEPDAAAARLRAAAGSQFDPAIVEVFLGLLGAGRIAPA